MPRFLNTELLNEWIPKLISTSQKELVIVVPFIQLSARVYDELLKADTRGVKTVIIYRENKLSPIQKEKLGQLKNLNQFEHPTVHCKTFFNGDLLLIGSMNLYEHSENNNREMGVLFARSGDGAKFIGNSWGSADDANIFTDFLEEYKLIQNGTTSVLLSEEYVKSGMSIEILKTPMDKTTDLCLEMKKVFGHKQFEPCEIKNNWFPVCFNYHEKLDVGIEIDRRAFMCLTYPEQRIESIYLKAKDAIKEGLFPGFKFYWNNHYEEIFLYPDSRDQRWKNIDIQGKLIEYRKGIDEIVTWLRRFI